MEGFMFDESVYDKAFELTVSDSSLILNELKPLLDLPVGIPIYLRVISSWATGFQERLSSTMEATKCLVGEGNWVSASPNPVYPQARNAQEGFYDDFDDEGRPDGFTTLEREIDCFNAQPAGALLVDTNEVLFGNNENRFFESIHNYLQQKRCYEMKREILGGEITVYKSHSSQLHFILVHRPLSLASDSRLFIKRLWRCVRGLAVTTLSHCPTARGHFGDYRH
jgi:hypothetical protein